MTGMNNLLGKKWCVGCMKRTGKRRFIECYKPYNVCLDCIKLFHPNSINQTVKEPEELPEPSDLEKEELEKIFPSLYVEPTGDLESRREKIHKIISEMTEGQGQVERIGRIIRQGLLAIDKLGGHLTLGYESDREFLETEFPNYCMTHLINMRATGRIEQMLEIPIGTYSIDAIKPLRKFRIYSPAGGNVKGLASQAFVLNQPNIAKLKEAWAIANELATKAKRTKPNRTDFQQAVNQLNPGARPGHRNWKHKYLELLAQQAELEAKCASLQKRCFYLDSRCVELQKQLSCMDTRTVAGVSCMDSRKA